jgi:uncharacterized protein
MTAVPGKLSTTVALDFGRISLDDALVLYLFDTPGQQRFSFLWDDLVDGAIGAAVILDTRRIQDCFIRSRATASRAPTASLADER